MLGIIFNPHFFPHLIAILVSYQLTIKQQHALTSQLLFQKLQDVYFQHLPSANPFFLRASTVLLISKCVRSASSRNTHVTDLWLIPLMMLVGDQRGSWAPRTTLRRNWFGFCTSGWADVSVWLRVYSWSQATRRIWNRWPLSNTSSYLKAAKIPTFLLC